MRAAHKQEQPAAGSGSDPSAAGSGSVDAATPPGPEGRRTRNATRRARRLAQAQADAMPVVEAGDGPRQLRRVEADLVPPAPKGGLLEVVQQPYLLRLIVSRQLAAMYAASLLGLLWSYVQPALRFGVYYVVMGVIINLHKGTPYFALHLFTGMVVVHYFGETWNGGTRSIWQNKALVKKMRMPRELFPVASMVVAAYHTLPQILVLVFCCLLAGWHLTWTAVAAGMLGVGILVTFSLALALTFSALNVFYRDFQNIVQTVMQFMHFLVPMMYPFSLVWKAHESHPWLYQIYVANPVTQAVLLLQRLFWYPLIENPRGLDRSFPPDMFTRGLVTLGVCLVLLWCAQRFFTRAEGKFPERI
jgi:ABC-2 type transport system permease protein